MIQIQNSALAKENYTKMVFVEDHLRSYGALKLQIKKILLQNT